MPSFSEVLNSMKDNESRQILGSDVIRSGDYWYCDGSILTLKRAAGYLKRLPYDDDYIPKPEREYLIGSIERY